MNPDTGDIYRIPEDMSEEEAINKGYVLLTPTEDEHMRGLNRAQRREYARKKKRADKRQARPPF